MAKLRDKPLSTATKTWAALPESLAYLEPALKALSRQDAERIGSGDGDFRNFDRDWATELLGLDSDAIFIRLAVDLDEFEDWVKANPGSDQSLLTAAWALIGYMRGTGMFGNDHWRALSTSEPPTPIFPSLTFDSPPGMTAKEIRGEWDVRNRVLDIVISGVPVDSFDSLNRTALTTLELMKTTLAGPPGLINDVNVDFRLGPVHGWRSVQRWKTQPLPFSASYLLHVPGGHADVRMVAKGKKGFDLTSIESFIATLKAKPAV